MRRGPKNGPPISPALATRSISACLAIWDAYQFPPIRVPLLDSGQTAHVTCDSVLWSLLVFRHRPVRARTGGRLGVGSASVYWALRSCSMGRDGLGVPALCQPHKS